MKDDIDPDFLAFYDSLQPGERVIETGECCTKGIEGTVYIGSLGDKCVRWEFPDGSRMGTSVTWGTKRYEN